MITPTTPTVGSVYPTGQKAPASAVYGFDGFTDGSHVPYPSVYPVQVRIQESAGQTLPPYQGKAAYWKILSLVR